ncbi:MAG: bifunctional diguanylate cyclase/phosphodiesterase [Anaeroplasmataceae bacterium]|nr:bifunctional diguanylate cyclase/phosphodiesterase [Anaeroplasmataceae bacterium]
MMIFSSNVGITILIVFICVLVVGGLAVLFYILGKKFWTIYKEKNNKLIDSAITKTEMMKDINTYIKKRQRFGAASFIYIDLDSFHSCIDVYGQKSCDDALRIIAKRIASLLPHEAKIANLNLDEFLIFIKEENNSIHNDDLCKKILEMIREPIDILEEDQMVITASIGVATYPQVGDSLNDILSGLEVTTYISKREGGNKATTFYASLLDDEKENMACYKEIKDAIWKKQFVLYYQPIIDFKDKNIYGAEALMRWNHPSKGVVAAKDFISLLEHSGDIHWVGEWGITQMIKFQQEMLKRFPNLPLVFSLNLSTKQLLNKNLARNLIKIAKKLNANPKRIVFEVTNFMVYEKISVLEDNIKTLKNFGFNVAVDGFGLDGQSILSVQKGPIDIIKLGRDFLKDIDNNFTKEKLLESLKEYVVEHHKTLISEGIENDTALRYVRKQDIFLGSGYYFSKPINQFDFSEYINEKRWQERLECFE